MFYELFTKLEIDKNFESALVLDITTNKQKTSINLKLALNRIVSRAKIVELAKKLKKSYDLARVTISLKYDDIYDGYLNTVKEYFLLKYPSLNGFLANSSFKLAGEQLEIKAENDVLTFFKNLDILISNLILEETGKNIKVLINYNFDAENDNIREQILAQSVDDLQIQAINNDQQTTQPVKEPVKSYSRPRKNAIDLKSYEEIILGKPFKEDYTKINDILADSGSFLIKGDVFFVETREIPNKDLFVLTFDITDYTSSVRVTKLLKKDAFLEISPKIHQNCHLIVQGTLEYSVYDKENIFKPTAIILSKAQTRQDFADKKRVELHLHSTMSAMDGVCNIADYIKLAKDFGHKAIAITDHGVVQAFPDAMNAGKKNNIKIIYGIEAYYFDDLAEISAVKNEKDYLLDDEIIVFDLETTGLRAKNEEIIEICAVTLKNGVKINEFHTYVKPNKKIPHKITELTGITNEIVADKPKIEEVIFDFVDFIGDRPLVAHNADFDMSFLYETMKKHNIIKTFTSIDTVTISRFLLPQLSRFRLNTVAKALNLGSFEHHRAADDTRILSEIYANFLNIFKEKLQITNINEINSALTTLKNENNIKKPYKTYHLIILVKNYIGLKNLYKIVSKSHLDDYFGRPVVCKSTLDKYREGLILGSACEGGELYSAIFSCKSDDEIEKIAKNMDFLEIQPLGNNQFMVEQELVSSSAELMKLNEYIVKLGEKLQIPVAATGDVHFKEPQDEAYRRILMASKGFSDADNQAPLYFKTTDEMLLEFDYLGSEKAFEVVVTNTNLIADMCDEIYAVPSETYTPTIEGSALELEEMSRNKVLELYGQNPDKIIIDRLEYELKSIIGNGFDVMYMIAQKLVAKSIECGYLVGSRGSVGSSFVAFLSGITEVNSLPAHYRCEKCKHTEFYENQGLCGCDMPDKVCEKCGTPYIKDGFDIPFATFLGFEGDKAPDIDLNFSGEYQERAHKHTEELFGRDHVFRAGTIGTIADKTAYGYVKKYCEERNLLLNRAEENRLSKGCTGVKRTTGQHPGGLMIVPREKSIYDFCPVQRPADDVTTSIITTHFDYHSIHDNLLKLDLLGHDDPTIIKVLYELTGINPQTVPLDDPETMKIFTDIKALGIEKDKILGVVGSVAIPEFGTKFVREMLIATKPKTFDELVRISGLSHGTDVWLSNAQELILNGTATLKDVICCRDDIMNFLIAKGVAPKLSFTIMESVRKGKGLTEEWEEEMKKNSVPEWYITSCKKIKYMFPKAHAVAYVLMAFRIAWFKVHYPIEFYSAYFSIRAKSFDASIMTISHNKILEKIKEINEKDKISQVEKDMLTTLEVCHEFYLRGFKFLPIDIYKSDANNFKIVDNSLLPPFTSMPGLGEAAALSIIEERKKDKFLSCEDLQLRCSKVSKTVIENLDQAGALLNIPKTTQISMF